MSRKTLTNWVKLGLLPYRDETISGRLCRLVNIKDVERLKRERKPGRPRHEPRGK